MKNSMRTILITLELMIVITLTAYSISPLQVQAQQDPRISIEPNSYQAQKIGETFQVDVNIYDLEVIDRVVGVQFRVTYNDTLLEALNATEGPFLQQFNNTVAPPYTYFVKIIEDDPSYGPNVVVGIILIPNATGDWTNFPEGNGTLATITFKAIYRPVEPDTAACGLKLRETMIMDEDLNGIDHTTTGARYEALQLPKPVLTVEPPAYTASLIGEVFQIDVDINDLDSDWRLTGAMFRVQYDAGDLEALNVIEGPFLQQFNNTVAPPYTYFINFIEDDPIESPRYGPNVLVGILVIPNATGDWTNFPEGNGTLATITFKAINQTGEPDPPASCMLKLNDTQLIDDQASEIPHTVLHGAYDMEPLSFNYQPSIPIAGQLVTFEAPDANYTVVYSWEFGDGTAMDVTGPTVDHIYSMPGNYDVTLTCIVDSLTSTVTKAVDIWPHDSTIDLIMDVGSIYFGGEIAEFNVLTTNYGEAVNATIVEAFLYHTGILQADLTSLVNLADTGYYTIPYNIPVDATAGTYTLIVKAVYYNAKGMSMRSFQISQTLTGWDQTVLPRILEIKNDTAMILNGFDYIMLNLTAIRATLVGVEGTVGYINSTLGPMIIGNIDSINATLSGLIVENSRLLAEVNSTLGNVYVDLLDINATITNIVAENGQLLVTIDTDLGTVTTRLDTIDTGLGTLTTDLDAVDSKVGDVKGVATTTLYVASALSAIAVILAALILLLTLKKR